MQESLKSPNKESCTAAFVAGSHARSYESLDRKDSKNSSEECGEVNGVGAKWEMRVSGVEPSVGFEEDVKKGECFYETCCALGVRVSPGVSSVNELNLADRLELESRQEHVLRVSAYGLDNAANHVELVSGLFSESCVDTASSECLVHEFIGYVSPAQFYKRGSAFGNVKFYASGTVASVDDPVMGFGADSSGRVRYDKDSGTRFFSDSKPSPPASVVDHSEVAGSSNMGGVVRSKRRPIASVVTPLTNYNYASTQSTGVATMFNNFSEVLENAISPQHADYILEDLFTTFWKLPADEPEVKQYAKDYLYTFLIARTASNKAAYHYEAVIPTRSGEKVVDFGDLDKALQQDSTSGILTRRRFMRGAADDLRNFLRRSDNKSLAIAAAARYGAMEQYYDLCFDGSSNCSGLKTDEFRFTAELRKRALFEDESFDANNSSGRILEGYHGGTPSKHPR